MTARPAPVRRHLSLPVRAPGRRALELFALGLSGALLVGFAFTYISLVAQGAAGPKQSDFVAYFAGARLVWTGHAAHLFDFTALGHAEASLVSPMKVRDGVLPFVYPPYFALLLAPFSALPYGAVFAGWLLLNVTIVGAGLAALQRYTMLRGRAAALFVLASACFFPLFVALAQGQTSPLLFGAFTAVLFAVRSRRDASAGALLACALIKPPYVVPFLVVLIARRRWRALAAFAGVATVLLVVPTVVLGASTLHGYLDTVRAATGWRSQFGYGPQWNHSLAGFWQLLLPGGLSTVATFAIDAVALGGLGAISLREGEIDRLLGVAAVVAILIAPHVLIHDLALLILPVAVALRYRDGAPASLGWVLTAGYAAVVVGLRVVDVVPLQLSVAAMSALGLWLAMRGPDDTKMKIGSASTGARPARPALEHHS